MATLDRFMNRLRHSAQRHDGDGMPDGDLLECFVALRDELAFEALVHRHGPMVFGVCRRILRNDADAEDAFQATFLVLVRKAGSIRPRGMVSNWLYGVAHNTALKARAMIYKRRMKETEAGTMPSREKTHEAWAQMQTVVDAELSLLPDKYRVPIVLCDLEGKTIKEAVHHLGWPQGTVASRLTRGRALLAKRLSKHGLMLSAGTLAGALTQGAASASVPAALTQTTLQAAALYAAGKTAAASGVSATAVALTEGMLKTMLLVKLKVAATAIVLLGALSAGVGGIAYHLVCEGRPAGSAVVCVSGQPPVPSVSLDHAATLDQPAPQKCEVKPPNQTPEIPVKAATPMTPPVTDNKMVRMIRVPKQSLEPAPLRPGQPAPVAVPPVAASSGTQITVHTILVEHGIDIKQLHKTLQNIPATLTSKLTTIRRQEDGTILIRVVTPDFHCPSSDLNAHGPFVPAWGDGEGKYRSYTVTIIKGKAQTSPVPAPPSVNPANPCAAQIDNSERVWVLIAERQVPVRPRDPVQAEASWIPVAPLAP